MRPQTHLMALLTILPKFDLSSAMGISSGFISVLIAFKDLDLMRNRNIVARSHLNQSFDFFRDVEVKPRRIFSSKSSLHSYNLLKPISRSKFLRSPSNWNKRLPSNLEYDSKHKEAACIEKPSLTQWAWPCPGLHSVVKIYLSRSSIQTTNYRSLNLSYLLSIIDCIRQDCVAQGCTERERERERGGKEWWRSLPRTELITVSWTTEQFWKHNMIPSYIYLSILLRTRAHSSRSSKIWSLPPMVVSANNIQLWTVQVEISSAVRCFMFYAVDKDLIVTVVLCCNSLTLWLTWSVASAWHPNSGSGENAWAWQGRTMQGQARLLVRRLWPSWPRLDNILS